MGSRQGMAAGIYLSALSLLLAAAPSRAGKKILIAAGTGVVAGNASKFEPYDYTGLFSFFPHARLSLGSPDRHQVGIEYARVASHSTDFFTRSELSERYHRFSIFHRRRFRPEELEEFDSGLDLFIQPGVNRFTRKDRHEIVYTGGIRDRYLMLGLAVAFEKTSWRFLNYGCRLGYLHEFSRHRRDDLEMSIGGEPPRRVYGNRGQRAGRIEFGIQTRLQISLGPDPNRD